MTMTRKLHMSAAVLALSTSVASAQGVEVLHWWTSGGEAAALNVLKEDLEGQGVPWTDMPVAGGGGSDAMTVLRARVTAGDPPTAVQMLGFSIQDWAAEGALANLNSLAEEENWGEVVPDDRPGDFNQALMELGALLCIPGRPGCLICPLSEVCVAKLRGLQDTIPPPKSRAVHEVASVAGVVRDESGRVLVARRPAEGQWGGLWEFPNVSTAPEESPQSALAAYLGEAFDIEATVLDEIAAFTYGVMNRRVTLTVLSCGAESGSPVPSEHDEVRWVPIEELAEIALPSPHRTIAEMLSADGT